MFMTDGEIATFYKQAKRPEAQIGILADLNGCSKYDIQKKLWELGLAPQPQPPQITTKATSQKTETRVSKKAPPKKAPTIDEDAFRAMYEAGETDQAIAAAVGLSLWRVGTFRREHGMCRTNHAAHRRTKKSRIHTETAKEMFLAGRSDEEIAKAFGVCTHSVQKWRHKNNLARKGGRKKCSFDTKEAMQLLTNGFDDQEISILLGVERAVIKEWRKRNGYLRPTGRNAQNHCAFKFQLLGSCCFDQPIVFTSALEGKPIKITVEQGG